MSIRFHGETRWRKKFNSPMCNYHKNPDPHNSSMRHKQWQTHTIYEINIYLFSHLIHNDNITSTHTDVHNDLTVIYATCNNTCVNNVLKYGKITNIWYCCFCCLRIRNLVRPDYKLQGVWRGINKTSAYEWLHSWVWTPFTATQQ